MFHDHYYTFIFHRNVQHHNLILNLTIIKGNAGIIIKASNNFIHTIKKNYHNPPEQIEPNEIIKEQRNSSLNSLQYLTYLFEYLPNADIQRFSEYLDDVLPWNDNIQQNCQ